MTDRHGRSRHDGLCWIDMCECEFDRYCAMEGDLQDLEAENVYLRALVEAFAEEIAPK